MPHLIERYALASGLKIDQPVPFENFFPLATDKYILVNASSGMPAKNYDYFNDVIRMIAGLLPDYTFVQIGIKDDVPLNGVLHLQGLTTIPQMMYLIKHCSLLLGNDSSAVHIASGYDKPIVALYGSTHPRIHGTYFGDKSKQKLLESHRNGQKPSYSSNELAKVINLIDPETVAQAALDALGIDHTININTVSIGEKYHAITLELVLDQVIQPSDFPNVVLNARMDYLFSEEGLFHNLNAHQLCIVTDKPFNIDILRRFRQNVTVVAYLIDNPDYDISFVQGLRAAGMPYSLVTTLQETALAKAKLDFFDYASLVPRKIIQKSDIENADKISKNTLYRSNRFILSDGKIFLNKLDWQTGSARVDQTDNEGLIIDDPKFYEDSDYYYFYNVKTDPIPDQQPA